MLLSIIQQVKNNPFVNVTTITKVKMNTTNNPFYNRVTKEFIGVVQIGYSYENSVNNRLEKIGLEKDFVAESLPWGHWVEGLENKVIEHKGKHYLRMYEVANQKPKVRILLDGKEVTDSKILEQILGFVPQKQSSQKQAEHGLEAEKQTKPRNVAFENIVAIKCGNLVYHI
jgi:hypothetical protein